MMVPGSTEGTGTSYALYAYYNAAELPVQNTYQFKVLPMEHSSCFICQDRQYAGGFTVLQSITRELYRLKC